MVGRESAQSLSNRQEKLNFTISVVIPLYNKKDSVRRTLQSVMSQLRDEDEVIVVDDGSTDGGLKDLNLDCAPDVRFRVITQKNMGVSVSRNRGLQEAVHQHIVFLDADDWWLSGFRLKIEEMISKWPDADVWTVGHCRADGDKRMVINSGLSNDCVLSGSNFINQYSKYSGLINSSSVCIKKEFLMSVGAFPVGVTSGEDIYVWLRLALLDGQIAVSPVPLVAVERSFDIDRCINGRDKVGFHFRYFSKRETLASYDAQQIVLIKRFLFRNGLRQMAGKIASGKRPDAWELVKTIGKISPAFVFVLLPLFLLPKQFFKFAFKKYRIDREAFLVN